MSSGYKGLQDVSSAASEFNAMSFLVTQILNRANTSTLVRVKAVTNSGGVSPVGYVDIEPLVMQVDGDGNTVPHGTIYNIPYFRLQGGTDAVILDPKVGDIGIAVFADHDISAVKSGKKKAAPGSGRRFDMADGMYLGGVLNGAPQQYVQFAAGGISLVSPTKITCQAPTVDIEATTATVNAATATITATTSAAVTAPAITLGASGQTLLSFLTSAFKDLFNTHTHTSAASGSPTSAPNQTAGASHMTTTVKGA